jgi:hypothetical protein
MIGTIRNPDDCFGRPAAAHRRYTACTYQALTLLLDALGYAMEPIATRSVVTHQEGTSTRFVAEVICAIAHCITFMLH